MTIDHYNETINEDTIIKKPFLPSRYIGDMESTDVVRVTLSTGEHETKDILLISPDLQTISKKTESFAGKVFGTNQRVIINPRFIIMAANMIVYSSTSQNDGNMFYDDEIITENYLAVKADPPLNITRED